MPDKWAKYAVPAGTPAPTQDKWAQYAQPAAQPSLAQVAPSFVQSAGLKPEPSLASRAMSAVGNVASGAEKGLDNTSFNLIDLANKGLQKLPSSHIPFTNIATSGPALGGIGPKPEELNPQGTAQKLGYGAEQIGEWLVPTGAEAKAASMASAHAPQIISKFAAPAAKLATGALESGARNVTQGGDFSTGAKAGLYGGVAAPVLNKAAQGLAGIAMAPGKTLLKSLPEGVDIGKTVLNESKGIRPGSIAGQLGGKVSAANDNLSNLLWDASQKGTQVPLTPARGIAADELSTALSKNSPDYIKDVNKVQDQLHFQHGPDGKPLMAASTPATRTGAGFTPVQVPTPQKMNPVALPSSVDPVRARALKQGIDLSIGNWNPEAQAAIAPLQERVRGSIAGAIHDAVPGAEALDQQMTSLIPAQKAAWNTAFNPSVGRKLFMRAAAPTGALTGALYGAHEGAKDGNGFSGALKGGLTGLVLPELVASPASQMALARILSSPAAVNAAKGAGLQFNRNSGTLYSPNKPPQR